MTVDDPLWYKDAVIYQTHVKTFYDASGDGIGDFRGLTDKLDYLQHLGVTAVWILPFYPSPLKDDGYDIADYTTVNPSYGTIRDFKNFLREAHARNLKVITELVLNHTSDRHPWFQRARRAKPGSRYREYYVWNDNQDKYRDARIIFQDFEMSNWSWDPVANAYFWHRFYHHQPDLNYDNPEVRKMMFGLVDHWFDMGVDGLRLDAVPYLFEREGTNCENLEETHQYLKELRAHISKKYNNKMLLAEANQWPEDAVAYFGDGDECHTAFHFPVMPRLFMGVQMEDRFPIIDILEQTPAIPDICQWVLFLRNHDELTLEMVTDEERDYMYRFYARDPRARVNLGIRRRLAPLLGNNRRKIELLNGLLMSLPGTPVIYYGDEIGMGDNIYLGDRDGVRTPMQWSADRNAGFSRANPQQLFLPVIIDHEYHYEAVNVETQHNNPHSLFWWMKRLIGLRQQFQAFGRGTLQFLYPDNAKVLAFVRSFEDQNLLVVANLSRFSQYVELDLSNFRGNTPIELFGGTRFPRVGELPYLLTLGPHAFYWFLLGHAVEGISQRQKPTEGEKTSDYSPRTISVSGSWDSIFSGARFQNLEKSLRKFLLNRRWFGGKARTIQSVGIIDTVPIKLDDPACDAVFVLVKLDYVEGEPDTYLIPLSYMSDEQAGWRDMKDSPTVVAHLQLTTDKRQESGILYDAMGSAELNQALLDIISGRRKLQGKHGRLSGRPTKAFRKQRGDDGQPLPATLLGAEQSNSAVVYGDRFLLKLFRRIEEGVNPDLEIGLFLTETAGFPNTPPVAGAIEYQVENGKPRTMAILQNYVRNEGDAWRYTLDEVGRYYERVLTEQATIESVEQAPKGKPLLDLCDTEVPPLVEELCGPYLAAAELLGRRTAEMHLALGSRTDDPKFAPESFTQLYQRSLYQSARSSAKRVLRLLEQRRRNLPEDALPQAEQVLKSQETLLERFGWLLEGKIDATRIRCHGDYHLGQVLFTGKDFVIIDFEGEPARPISERLIKRSPLRDVAGMLRSFSYASYFALSSPHSNLRAQVEDVSRLQPWATFWSAWISATFLKAFLATADGASFVPAERTDIQHLLDVYLLDKAVYELAYELNNRPDWVRVPLAGILQLLETH